MANLGSILYTLRSISNGLVTGWQHFDINRSMMRKLYTAEKENGAEGRTSLLANGEDLNDKKAKIRKEINERRLFDYSFFAYLCRIRCCCKLCLK